MILSETVEPDSEKAGPRDPVVDDVTGLADSPPARLGAWSPAGQVYRLSILRLMLTCWRVSNWLTVLVSLFRLLYWA